MSDLFCDKYNFNNDISNWDVSLFINMSHIFMSTKFMSKIYLFGCIKCYFYERYV